MNDMDKSNQRIPKESNSDKKNKTWYSKIKMQIVVHFISSAVVALFLSLGVIFLFFLLTEHLFNTVYQQVIHWYNGSFFGQFMIVGIFFLLFIVNTYWIFMRKMNVITDAIDELSKGIEVIAEGDFDEKIEVGQNNELGKLAEDINGMARKLKDSTEKERLWNRQRYNMITNLSHDLKTPMMSIMGYVDFIAKKKYRDEQELATYCSIIERKTEELNHNINQLFQLSKISSYDYKLEKQSIHIREFAEQILMGYIPQFEEKEMEYVIQMPADLTITADIDLLKRIFENIISNTIKYAADGKKIEITARQETEQTVLIFRNFGTPIAEEDIEKIFEKYYRKKENTKAEGSGYGLYIVKRIVELHGGVIRVNSSEECTEFIVVFP